MHQTYFAIFEARVNNWAGIDYKTPRGTFGPRRIVMDPNSKGPFYRYNYTEKQTYFSAFHISAKNIANYLHGLTKYKAEYMTGYCMSNFILARFIEESGMKAPKLKAVLTSSEKLTVEMRDTFRRVYGCETFDSYNGVEACNLVSECEYHSLHIVPDVGYTEIINSNGEPCQPGETGQVVATGFLNFDQPLIRYKMGDLLTLSKNQNCKCGRNMPVVEEIVGRIMDTVITYDMREMVSFYRVFSNNTSIMESQVIQHTLYDFDVNLLVNKPLSNKEKEIVMNKLYSQLGEKSVIRLNFVNEIQRGANGKFKSVISHVNRERK
jgi:phenylacetate-CoA ligase